MKQILILKTSHLGDTLRTTVILEGLKEKYIDSDITWITSKSSKPLLKNNLYIDNLITEEEIHTLQGNWYDIVISLQEEKELLQKIYYEINFNLVYGTYLENNRVVYTPSSKEWYDMSLISNYTREEADNLKILNKKCQGEIYYNMLDLKCNNNKFKTYYNKTISIKDKLDFKLNPEFKTIGIVLNAGKSWIMKSLYPNQINQIVEVINYLMKDRINIILLSEDYEEDHKIYKYITYNKPNIGFNNHGDLNDYINVLDKCDIILTPDSLATHIGIGLDKFIICYFTITSYNEINLYNKGHKIISKDLKRRLSYFRGEDERPNCVDKIDINKIIKLIMEEIKK